MIWPAAFIFLSIPFTLLAIWVPTTVRPGKHRCHMDDRYTYVKCDGIADHGFRLLAMGISIILTVGLWITAGSVAWSDAACDRLGRNLNTEAAWELVGGCYVRVGDRWMPESVLTPVVEDGRIQLEVVGR